MNDFFNREFYDNLVKDYFWVIGVVLFVLLLKRIISKYIASLLCRIFTRNWKNFNKEKFIELIVHPLGVFLVITISIVAFYRLNFPEELNVTIYKYPLQEVLHSIAITIQLAAFIWLLLRIIDFIADVLGSRAMKTQDQADNQLIIFFRDFLKVILGIVGVVMILKFAFGFNVSSLLTGLSIVGAAIALALRESLENLIASFVIFFDKPFTTGDFVKVQQVAGVVERIGLRSTRVRTTEKSYVTVPNKQMVDSILDNITLRSQIRGEINLHIQLKTPSEKILALQEAIKQHISGVREIQASTVLFNDIRVQSFVLFIEFFTPNMEWPKFTAVKQGLNYFILQKMEELGIHIAAEGKDLAIVP